ncbi:MAG: tetratricopeptide repeat protein [Chitinophagaceae bacterium]|nr:tetratricopeptide repeat protein [Chitinophagaceae bacterium]
MKLNITLFSIVVVFCLSSSAKSINPTIQSNSDSAGFYFTKAQESRAARKIWDAEKYYKKALEFNSNEEEIRADFALYYIEQRKYALALQQYTLIVEKNPNHTVAVSKQIELSFTMRKWLDVIKYGEAALAGGMKVEKLNFMIGKSYYEDENYGKARKFLTEQFKQTPTHRETITLLGAVFVEMSMYNDAIAMYQKAIESNPKDFELMYEIGLLFSAQHNEREAVKYFEMAAANGMGFCFSFEVPPLGQSGSKG